MSGLERIGSILEPWAEVYGDSVVLQVGVMFLHLAGLLVGGGAALAEDRLTLQGPGGTAAQLAQRFGQIGAAHRVVLGGLALTALSGVLMLAADFEALATSVVFWTKMGLIVLLLGNGALMLRLERRVRAEQADASAAWRGLKRLAATSALLWLAILLVSVLLVETA